VSGGIDLGVSVGVDLSVSVGVDLGVSVDVDLGVSGDGDGDGNDDGDLNEDADGKRRYHTARLPLLAGISARRDALVMQSLLVEGHVDVGRRRTRDSRFVTGARARSSSQGTSTTR